MAKVYSVGEFADELGVHRETVKKWCREDQIQYSRTPGGHRRVPHTELQRLTGKPSRRSDKVAIYRRVSGHAQKRDGDLDRQLELLTEYAHNRGWSIEDKYSDVGSGLNENRRGLNKLLDGAENADYGRVLVTYQDRLTRFGFSYLERLLDQYDVEITVINEGTDKTAHDELADDLLQLVASFASKLYGMRSSKRRRIVEIVEAEVETNE
ncbi:IS607 family transposase [Halorubrum sp. SD626R]|uniref:IS607 family transposase n=1 Tax=Halorubrum sp. SD626R TaxID=1419722 RepID=UPI000A840D1A|nr:IS607 family transposase [Halorubrum sp. SD626R]TKX81219.1 IS607 family transposase [Halorubrum sp. SD626R]